MRSTYLAFAACVGLGGYFLVDHDAPAASPAKPRAVRTAKLPSLAIAPALTDDEPPADLDLDVPADDEPLEAIRGHETITDPAEFAMVFDVDGTLYLRLSDEHHATARGAAKLTERDGVTSVVAPVSANALPSTFRSWVGRSVLVDGTCRARVVGFAEVSRVSGDASDPYAFDEDDQRIPVEGWTVERVTESNVTLAAQLDDACDGTWARADSYAAAAVATHVDAPDLERAARDDLFASIDEDMIESWKQMGGEGSWQDAASITTSTWQHPLTNERWVFVQAHRDGSCGEASFSHMAAYRVGESGKLRLATTMRQGGSTTIQHVVDLDGDGQPELVVDDGDSTELVDLADRSHETIHVPDYHYGCGC